MIYNCSRMALARHHRFASRANASSRHVHSATSSISARLICFAGPVIDLVSINQFALPSVIRFPGSRPWSHLQCSAARSHHPGGQSAVAIAHAGVGDGGTLDGPPYSGPEQEKQLVDMADAWTMLADEHTAQLAEPKRRQRDSVLGGPSPTRSRVSLALNLRLWPCV